MQRVLLAMVLVIGGCVNGNAKEPAKRATAVEPKTATPLYWLEKPATAKVTATNYDRLWTACDAAVRAFRFIPDRNDYRQGVMITQPLISRSLTEFWRNDVPGDSDLAHATLATYRRTIVFELDRQDDDRFEVGVKVLVERSSAFEHRVTTGIQFRDAFGAFPPGAEFRSDDGVEQPAQYWYAVGRDQTLEKDLAQKIRENLSS